MGGSKPKVVQLPEQKQQTQTNTFGQFSIADSPEAQSFLSTPLNFGGGNYGGDAYKDIKTDFDIDPGVGRRTDLAEQGAQNRWNSAFMGGIPQEYRQLQRDSEQRQIRGQGAAEAQQAQYGRQQLQNQASVTQAQMRDQGELARANMANNVAAQQTAAELERRRLLLPQILQTGGTGSSSGYSSQVQPGQQGIFGSLLQGAGSAVGGLAAGGFL